MPRVKKKKEEETELINDPGLTLQEEVARVLEDNSRKKPGKAIILHNEKVSKTARTPEAISRALVAAGGRVSYASIILGMTPKKLREKIRNSEELVFLQNEIKEFRIDIAESKLDQRVLQDKYPAIQFTLETIGKQRGYTKRTEVTGADGDRLVFEFSDGKKEEL